MANDPWGFFGLEEALKTQIEKVASAINKEVLEKNLNNVVEGLKNNKDINALLGLESEPSKIEVAGPAPASAKAPSPAKAPAKAPAPALAQSQTPSFSSQVSSTQASASSGAHSVSSRVSSLFGRRFSTISSSSDSNQNQASSNPLSRSASTSSQKSDRSSNNSNKSSASFSERMRSFRSSVSSSHGSVSSENSSKSQPNKGAPSRVPSATYSKTPSRTPPKDYLGQQEVEGKKLSILKRVSSGLSECKSSLSNLALHYNVSKNKETLVEGRVPLRLPRSSSFPGPGAIKSGLGRSASRLERGASGLGRTLSNKFSQAKEGLGELRRESSSLGESWRDAKKTLSLGGFSSGSGPSSISFTNLGSGRTSYKEDARATLREVGDLMGAASSQTRDWASNFRRSASELSLRAWVSGR